ncbi:hypothetical protein DERP_000551 [Dermatophagoides pteronyssinus]|uniref:Uncharacterized protein n=1 Tax=Dermatophagoides pteronyssinus TaxID=6956 RepID=A0ABQ8J108_DERPT|nr:hypothetical protein DERP_000551 [Dermatophagoides pteronyssinus]
MANCKWNNNRNVKQNEKEEKLRLENSDNSLAITLSSLTLPGKRESRPPIVVLINESSRKAKNEMPNNAQNDATNFPGHVCGTRSP